MQKGTTRAIMNLQAHARKQKCMRDRETVNIVWLINKHTLPYKDDVASFNGILHQHEKNHFACMVSTAGIRRDKMLLNT